MIIYLSLPDSDAGRAEKAINWRKELTIQVLTAPERGTQSRFERFGESKVLDTLNLNGD